MFSVGETRQKTFVHTDTAVLTIRLEILSAARVLPQTQCRNYISAITTATTPTTTSTTTNYYY